MINNFQFKTKPYEHQLQLFDKHKDQKYFGLFADMGTGKTKVTIDIMTYKFLKKEISACLIIAPNLVHEQWINEQLPLHCAIDYKAFIWESAKIARRAYKYNLDDFLMLKTDKIKIFAVNVEAFQSKTVLNYIAEFVHNHNAFIVCDESTRIKTPTAIRSKMIHKLNKYGQRCILTGTPATKSPFDLWSQFEFLQANYFRCAFIVFKHRYGILIRQTNIQTGARYETLIDEGTFYCIKKFLECRKKENGDKLTDDIIEAAHVIYRVSEKNIMFINEQEKFTRFKRLDELKRIISADVSFIKKEECLDLPSKIYEKCFVELSKEQRKIYNNLKTEFIATYEDRELSVQNKVTLTMRFMQICGGFFPYYDNEENKKYKLIGKTTPKLERLKEELDEVGDKQIIIWATFVAELEYLYNELKKNYRCFLYYGKTKKYEKQKIVEQFKNNEYQIFIGNPTAAGFGLNLQSATIQFWYSNTFRTEARLQAEDRSHRIGITNPVLYKDFICKNTVDEKLYQIMKEGKDLNDFFKSNKLADII
jgi:SNF2 family DNA or RNA helicase